MNNIRGIRVGKPTTSPTAPSHVHGVGQGNWPHNLKGQPGQRPDGTATASRSTGINPTQEEPIDPRMPNLSPA